MTQLPLFNIYPYTEHGVITCRCLLNTTEVGGRCVVCALPKRMKTIQPDKNEGWAEPSGDPTPEAVARSKEV